MAAHISTVQNSRLKTMVVPREHGAWGMLLVPLATGLVLAAPTGINGAAVALFITVAMSLFWLRTPVESWLGTSAIKAQTPAERRFVGRMIVAIGSLAALSLAALLWSSNLRGLIIIGTVSALAFAVQAAVKQLGRRGRMPAQVIGAIGLTSTAAGAYCVATGRLDRIAIALWVANWLFAGNQIHFVQIRIRYSRAASFAEKLTAGLPFLLGQAALLAAIVASWQAGLFPAWIAAAFLPVLLRGMWWFTSGRQPLDVHKLGFNELGQSLLFGVLLCAAFLF
ncbi:MAG TPA: YwiC-like family protein [Terriglobales bacterium]|nr:YwiC-like family protein [Terriglobales bacterium]